MAKTKKSRNAQLTDYLTNNNLSAYRQGKLVNLRAKIVCLSYLYKLFKFKLEIVRY